MTRTVEARGWRYAIADDDPVPGDARHWAIVRAEVFDELTGAPPRAALRVRSNLARAHARAAASGLCGLVARPRDAWQALLTPGALEARVEAEGFLPLDLTPAIEAARHKLGTGAGVGQSALHVVPLAGTPPPQFRPGRGAMLEPPPPPAPPALAPPAEFHAVETVPSATAITLDQGLGAARAIDAPIAPVPLVLGRLAMHRDGVARVIGRARVRASATSALPATAARIGIAGLWHSYADNQTTPPLPVDLCAVDPPLRFAHPPGASVQSCTLLHGAPFARVDSDAAPGAHSVRLAPNAPFAPAGGQCLRLGDPLSAEAEIVVTAPFAAPPDAGAAFDLPLTAPTTHAHRRGEPVAPASPTPSPLLPGVGVSREAQPGDRVHFLSGLGSIATTETLLVDAGTPREAYYKATQFPTWDGTDFHHWIAPDTSGRFEWPALARVARVRIFARHAPQADQTLDFALDFGGANPLEIVFS